MDRSRFEFCLGLAVLLDHHIVRRQDLPLQFGTQMSANLNGII